VGILRRRYAATPAAQPALDAFIAATPGLRHLLDFLASGDLAEQRFHAWMQMLADQQLGEAAQGLEIGLIRDLAVGAAPDGAEAAACADILAQKISIGAPPDPFSAEGQVWGLPPPIPHRMRATGYAAFSALLQANLRHAGGLRIDHVMGLSRLFWVPAGAPGRAGAYVSYPFDDLLGILALESHRARAVIIGEDLGTVPEGFRERLERENILGCRVLLLEREGSGFRPAAAYSARAVASVSTHDLPTLAGWRQGTDIAERAALGFGQGDLAGRAAEVATLDALVGADPHGFVAASPACLVLAQADDLAGETRAVNLPGTDTERPNWRRRLAPDIARLFSRSADVLGAMRPGRTRTIAKPPSGC
jgi:glycogen operon protein